MTSAEITRYIRAALKQCWPDVKFSVSTSYHGVRVSWDDGPTTVEIGDGLLRNGRVEQRGLRFAVPVSVCGVKERDLTLLRYSAAERIAAEEFSERLRQRHQRETELVRQATQAKWDATPKPPRPPANANTDASIHAAFETLRQRAEADVAIGAERERRPSWGPPMILEGELVELCKALSYLALDEQPIARLWADFADRKPIGNYFRKKKSAHTLPGIYCRSFRLHVGTERSGPPLFEAQKHTGGWQFGPRLWPASYESPRRHGWENLLRERMRAQEFSEAARVIKLTQQIAAIDAEDLQAAQAHNERQRQRLRVIELARVRVLDFVGAPDAQMQIAGRLCGRCCICSKELTDPISLERGIGPDCYAYEIANVIAGANWLRRNGEDVTPEKIARLIWRPVAFVATVLLTECGKCGAPALKAAHG